MLTNEILDNIKEFQEALEKKNDGVEATKLVAQSIIELVQATFNKAQGTSSIDDRIQFLIEGLQGVVKIAEDSHNQLEKSVLDLKLQIETLENLLDRVKKFESEAGEQNVTLDDEREKKGDEPTF